MAIVGAAVWITYKKVEAAWKGRVRSELSAVVARDAATVLGRARGTGEGSDVAAEFERLPWPRGFGTTGDSYVFDADGRILWRGRGAENPGPGVDLTLRNPGGNSLRGFRSIRPRKEQPWTKMAQQALLGQSGSDLDGYRDFQGVPVVGVWRWLPKARLGVAAELSMEEAFGGLYHLYFGVLAFFGLLLGAASGVFTYTRVALALRRRLKKVERLGQYTLQEKIGEGGMGKVYRASHALLKRPTAIKLIAGDSDDSATRRFEREVQLTSQLTHPNTINVYDFGRTPDGSFYYAMEYLDGFTLDQIVSNEGPLPAPRAVHFLCQVLGSLAEAHLVGVIHRDIKPSNVMVCRRGGIGDFVKVLDFGLARNQTKGGEDTLTQANTITGTPHYMSPESIVAPDTIDARSDLYAVGALAYFLLTGKTVFEGQSPMAICASHLHERPKPLTERVEAEIQPELEILVRKCLNKDREQRPASAEELRASLQSCCSQGYQWTREDALRWWEENEGRLRARYKSPKSSYPRSRVIPVAAPRAEAKASTP